LRSAYLSGYTLGDRGVYIGFRLARTVS
jgi:hypothetical protein